MSYEHLSRQIVSFPSSERAQEVVEILQCRMETAEMELLTAAGKRKQRPPLSRMSITSTQLENAEELSSISNAHF